MFLQGDPSTFVALVAALGLGGALGLIIGLLVGAGIVLALVPQAGPEIQEKLRRLF